LLQKPLYTSGPECGVAKVQLIYCNKEVTNIASIGWSHNLLTKYSFLFLIHGKMQVDDRYWGDGIAS